MDSKASSAILIFAAVFLISTSVASAHNITRLLGKYPDFSNFNDLLTQTELNKQINSRKTITVLAISNDDIGPLTSKPEDLQKAILSIQVILDYYDAEKLSGLTKKSTVLTTLYQSSGVAANQQGFLNVTKSGGKIVFASANHKGDNANATLVGAVDAQPYNISVLQVSGPIVPSGMDVINLAPAAAPPPKGAKAPAKAPKKAPTPAESPDAPSDAPESDAPSPADSPVADAPDDSPISSPPAPAADDDADAPAPSKSSSSRVAYSIGVAVFMGGVSSLFA